MRSFMRLCDIPGVECQRAKGTRWVVRYESEEWLVWPNSGRWARSKEGIQTGELYFGGIRYFIARYIEKSISLPANHCKGWTNGETECIYEMCSLNMTINQIATEMERHPTSMATRIGQLFDIDLRSAGYHREVLLDVGLQDILDGKQ